MRLAYTCVRQSRRRWILAAPSLTLLVTGGEIDLTSGVNLTFGTVHFSGGSGTNALALVDQGPPGSARAGALPLQPEGRWTVRRVGFAHSSPRVVIVLNSGRETTHPN